MNLIKSLKKFGKILMIFLEFWDIFIESDDEYLWTDALIVDVPDKHVHENGTASPVELKGCLVT